MPRAKAPKVLANSPMRAMVPAKGSRPSQAPEPGDVVPTVPAVAVAVPTTAGEAIRNAFDMKVGGGMLDKLLPYAVAILVLVAGCGYLFGFIPSDRITGLVTLLGGLSGGFFIRSAGSNANLPSK